MDRDLSVRTIRMYTSTYNGIAEADGSLYVNFGKARRLAVNCSNSIGIGQHRIELMANCLGQGSSHSM